jgi:hypothetical protein
LASSFPCFFITSGPCANLPQTADLPQTANLPQTG